MRRSAFTSMPASVTGISVRRTWKTSPTASPGEAETPSSKLGSVDFRRGAGAAAGETVVVAGAGAGMKPSSPQPCASTAVSFVTAARDPLARDHLTFAPCPTSAP